MANVAHFHFAWVSMEGGDMAPGEEHYWWMAPAIFGESYSITAHPVVGDPTQPHRTLAVDSVRVVGEPDGGRTLLFTVRNAGGSFIVAYGVDVGVIDG